MTLEPYDFRKPQPLPPVLRVPLTQWLAKACQVCSREWPSQLPGLSVELEPLGVFVLSASDFQSSLPESSVEFRSTLLSSGASSPPEGSLLVVSRPLLTTLVLGQLGDTTATATSTSEQVAEFTPVEVEVAEFVAQQYFQEVLQRTWPLSPALRFSRPQRTHGTIGPGGWSPETLLLVVRVAVHGSFGEQHWWWVLPRGGWLEQFSGGNQVVSLTPAERETLVGQLPVRLSVRLGVARVPLVHLAVLRVGDVLLLDQPVNEPLIATLGGRVKYLVWPGVLGARQAVAVHSLVEA